MGKSTVVLLQIILAASAVLSKSIQSEKEFIYIGSFKSSPGIQGRAASAFDENDYYMSINPSTWSAAVQDCKTSFGTTTVAIESPDEWEFLKVALEPYEATTYWTSGMYDFSASTWRWSANSNAFLPSPPWGTGFPSTPNAVLRVLLFYANRYDANWRTVANTQLHRYVCEVQKTTVAVPCYRSNDLVVVLDSSGSITSPNYEIAKDFVRQLADAFTVLSTSRLAFLIFSSTAKTIIDLENTFTPEMISSTILDTEYQAGGTATNLGIELAIAQFNAAPRDVPLNMALLTDGFSNNSNFTLTSAAAAASYGIRSFSVGIGSYTDQQELLAIAGGDSSHMFSSADFNELIKILAPLSLKICPDK